MEVTRIKDAKAYEAPKHFNMTAQRLQGLGASGAEHCSVAFSTFAPGGGAENSATPVEKIYVVVSGEIVVKTDSQSVTLTRYDSCRIEPNEFRTMLNESDAPAEVLVIVPTAT